MLIAGLIVLVGAVGCGSDEQASPNRHLTAKEICILPQLVPCESIDGLSPGRRKVLEDEAREYLHGRTYEQAKRDRDARRAEDAAEAAAAGPPPEPKGEPLKPGRITRYDVQQQGFVAANSWYADERLAGLKNFVEVDVGSATADPATGLLVRVAVGETVRRSTAGKPPRAVSLPIRGRGAHIATVNNKTGILTIAVASGKTVRYDGIRGEFLR